MFLPLVFRSGFCVRPPILFIIFFLLISIVGMEFPPRVGLDIENPRTASAWVGPLLLGSNPSLSMPLPIDGLTLEHCQVPLEIPPGAMRLPAVTLEYSWRRVHGGDVRSNLE